MKNKTKFFLSSLAVAGFAIPISQSYMSSDSKLSSVIDEISKKPIFNYLDREVSYTLAAHGSHRSHQSHGSHRSHRSYHKPMDPQDEREIRDEFHSTSFAAPPNLSLDENKDMFSRNINSTPNKSILPSSANLVHDKKVIKGTNKEFSDITRSVQIYLSATGHYNGHISGNIDNELTTAITMYQRKNNLEVTGSLSDELIKHMNVSI